MTGLKPIIIINIIIVFYCEAQYLGFRGLSLTFCEDVCMLPTSRTFSLAARFPNQSALPVPNTVRIACGLLHIPSVKVSKRQCTTFEFN
jgi:hypothetical protein